MQTEGMVNETSTFEQVYENEEKNKERFKGNDM